MRHSTWALAQISATSRAVASARSERHTKTTRTAVADKAGCGAMSFDLAVFKSEIDDVVRIAGRAQNTQTRDSPVTSLWVEGYLTPDDVAEFEVRQQQPLIFGARPYWLWRGTRQEDGTIVVREPEPFCGREATLALK